MVILDHGHLKKGLAKLLAEPASSSCRSLALGNAALIFLRMERFTEAEKLLNEALTICEKKGCPHPPSWVQFARNLAESIFRERTVESLRYFNGAIWLSRDLQGKHPEFEEDLLQQEAHTFCSWGAALMHLGDFEAAIDCYEKAGDIYRKHPSFDREGESERLNNYAHALRETGETTKAYFALDEARDISRKAKDWEHLQNIEVAMIQLDFDRFDGDPYKTLELAAESALKADKPSTSYVRHSIRASIAHSRGDYEYALEACNAAIAMEDQLDLGDPSRARLWDLKALTLRDLKRDRSEILEVLLKSGKMWWSLLAREQSRHDVSLKTSSVHVHCCLLAMVLLEDGRPEESCIAFETGRALAFALDVNPKHLDAIIAMNPYVSNDGTLARHALHGRQSELAENEVLLSTILYPASLVTFVICKDSVNVHCIECPDEAELIEDASMIPTRLHAKVGLRAIPPPLLKWADELAPLIGTRRVRAIAPHSFLHSVPWRTLLRHSGCPWEQMPSVTRFGLFLPDPYSTISLNSCTALSLARPGEDEIVLEASDFASHFSSNGSFIPNASSLDVRGALVKPGIVLISCHGEVRPSGEDGRKRFHLLLKDGWIPTGEIWPESVIADMTILSACESGVYEVAHGDYPVGAAPNLLRAGAKLCLGTRYPVNSLFAAGVIDSLGRHLAQGEAAPAAFASSLQEMEGRGFDLWKDFACFELIG
jgi:tetratricopeptide (TPR) repeat protein